MALRCGFRNGGLQDGGGGRQKKKKSGVEAREFFFLAPPPPPPRAEASWTMDIWKEQVSAQSALWRVGIPVPAPPTHLHLK